jgi:hypothetical protein
MQPMLVQLIQANVFDRGAGSGRRIGTIVVV